MSAGVDVPDLTPLNTKAAGNNRGWPVLAKRCSHLALVHTGSVGSKVWIAPHKLWFIANHYQAVSQKMVHNSGKSILALHRGWSGRFLTHFPCSFHCSLIQPTLVQCKMFILVVYKGSDIIMPTQTKSKNKHKKWPQIKYISLYAMQLHA